MRMFPVMLGALLTFPAAVAAQKPPLLPESEVAALAQELSGETAKRNLEVIATYHRIRGSRGFHAAAQLIADRARSYGLSDVQILTFPADGKIFYGTQRSRPPWDADFAELWEMRQENGAWTPAVRLASWDAMPITLAEDSESADVTADLVDVGDGTHESDYSGKDVRGEIVLASQQADAVARMAVEKFGAAGIVSAAQNQPTAWSGEDENLIRWGHLDTFAKTKTFAFMVSLKTARALRARLARGEQIRLHAVVRAGQHAGGYEVVTATIPGTDAGPNVEEIAFSCHLDHQRPGANDNASGCVTILEVGRTLAKLIREGELARPARTLRFIWPPEIEGTMALLNARPEFAARIKAVVHMDMVGGSPATKAVFHVTRGPMSLPSFIHDVAWAFAEFVNEQSYQFAATGRAAYPLVAPEGGKEPLQAQWSEYTMGSDHDVYQDSWFHIPAIYMNDWPDRYIHTNFDSSANIDPTKLKRAAFIGAASGYFLAQMKQDDAGVLRVIEPGRLAREANTERRTIGLNYEDAENLRKCNTEGELGIIASAERFVGNSHTFGTIGGDTVMLLQTLQRYSHQEPPTTGEGLAVFRRKGEPRGPLVVFGYDYLTDRLGAEAVEKLALLHFQGERGAGEEYAYEILNFVDANRNAKDIRDFVSAEYGPVPEDTVYAYIAALEKAGVISRVH